MKEAQAELKRILAEKREEKRKKAAAKDGKERRPESSKGRSEEALQVPTGNCCSETNKAVSEDYGTLDQEAALPATGSRNCKRQ